MAISRVRLLIGGLMALSRSLTRETCVFYHRLMSKKFGLV